MDQEGHEELQRVRATSFSYTFELAVSPAKMEIF